MLSVRIVPKCRTTVYMLNIIVGCLSPAFRKIIRPEKPCMDVFPDFSWVQDPRGVISDNPPEVPDGEKGSSSKQGGSANAAVKSDSNSEAEGAFFVEMQEDLDLSDLQSISDSSEGLDAGEYSQYFTLPPPSPSGLHSDTAWTF